MAFPLLASFVMAAVTYGVAAALPAEWPAAIRLPVEVATGASIYGAVTFAFKRLLFYEALALLRR
jgi:hypothetical protein